MSKWKKKIRAVKSINRIQNKSLFLNMIYIMYKYKYILHIFLKYNYMYVRVFIYTRYIVHTYYVNKLFSDAINRD